MPLPQSKKQVQSFIGMVNYLSKFSAHLSELTEPIRELAKERVPFIWGPEHDEAFSLIKKELTAAPVLSYCNPKKLTVLQTDASWQRARSMPPTEQKACPALPVRH